ncbi:MAG TPA: sugar kinase, partial [Limnochordia bacterium]
MPQIVACGETMVLFAPATSGPLRYVHQFTKHIGGAESNVCIGAVRLGHSAGWISRLGDDEFGRYVLAQLRGEGVDVSRVRIDPAAPTGVYFKERHETKESRVFYYRRGSAASRLCPADLDPDYIGDAEIILISGITPALSQSAREAVFAAVRLAREAGRTVAFDPNVRLKLWPPEEAVPVLRELAARSDVLLPGAAEASLLTGEADPERAAAALLALDGPAGHHPEVAVVKLGEEGALVARRRGSEI